MNNNNSAPMQAEATTSGGGNIFRTYESLGYGLRCVPIIPPHAPISPTSSLAKRKDARGKAVGVKGRDGNWHGLDWIPYTPDEHDLDRWHAMGAGLGIKTGDGLVAIDADTTNEDWAKIVRDTVREIIGKTPIRVGRYPKALYLVRVAEPYRYARVEFGERSETGALQERVEILSDGRQFVAHGTHPTTGKPYTWPAPLLPFEGLPTVSAQQLDQLLNTLRERLPKAADVKREGATSDVNQAALKGDLETVRKAVAAIPNTSEHFPTRESYRDFGYAIKAALPDYPNEAFAIFEDWCARWKEGSNDPGVVSADWRRMKPPFRRGAGWIYELAETLNPKGFSTAEAWFEDFSSGENPFAEIDPNFLKGEEAQKKRFVFEQFGEAANAALADPAKPLIKGLLDQGAMSIVYGDSNVGKTFVVMDMAYHVAAGLPYGGMKTERAVVVYVAAEGGKAARKRLAALRDKYRPSGDVEFYLLPAPVDLRRPDIDLEAFKNALAGLGKPIGLLVIDTVSRAMAGGDENSSVDMGALVKHFDLLRTWSGAHLMGVHHTGKDQSKGARGHSLLRAATDTEIEIGGGGVISVTKQRDLDKSWQCEFTLEQRVIGLDTDGEPVTSCTVLLRVGAAEKRKGVASMTAMEQQILDAMRALSTSVGDGLRPKEIECEIQDRGVKMGKDTVATGLLRMRKKGLVEPVSRGVWKLSADGQSCQVLSKSLDEIFQ